MKAIVCWMNRPYEIEQVESLCTLLNSFIVDPSTMTRLGWQSAKKACTTMVQRLVIAWVRDGSRTEDGVRSDSGKLPTVNEALRVNQKSSILSLLKQYFVSNALYHFRAYSRDENLPVICPVGW
jgi:hypothetical protein